MPGLFVYYISIIPPAHPVYALVYCELRHSGSGHEYLVLILCVYLTIGPNGSALMVFY